MKRTKLLALTLVVAIMLVGAGYAAWTDKIELNYTVDTGEFKVDLLDVEAKARIFENGKYRDATASDYTIVNKTDVGRNTVKFGFENLYPGTQGYSRFIMKNNGSIRAVVNEVSVVATTTEDVNADRSLERDMIINVIVNKRTPVATGDFTLKPIADFNTNMANIDARLEEALLNLELEPGEELIFGNVDGESLANSISYTIPAYLTGDIGENETATIEYKINFIQYNLR